MVGEIETIFLFLLLKRFLLDRSRTIRWMRKLAACNRTINEMKLRNDFMYYLVLNVQNGELRTPFTENPTPGPLSTFAHLLVMCLLICKLNFFEVFVYF